MYITDLEHEVLPGAQGDGTNPDESSINGVGFQGMPGWLSEHYLVKVEYSTDSPRGCLIERWFSQLEELELVLL